MLKLSSALLLLLLAAPAAMAQTVPTERMQQIIARSVAAGTFTGSVLVVKDKAVLLDQGYGAADLEWKIPNSPATRFRLGSLTKQFTAVSILLLQERGKLNVDELVSKYLPDAPAAWSQITIRNVLNHTSGIPNFTSFPDYHESEWKDTTPAELVARFAAKPLDFAPGTKFSYSNSGYVLLGYMIEKITGSRYADFLQANIFTPLGMADSGVDDNEAILLNRAQGYSVAPQGFKHAGYISMTIPFSAGALYSTTGDLYKWEQALYTGNLLKPASLAQMTTPALSNYGFGIIQRKVREHRQFWHNGGIEGFTTSMAYYPDDHLTVIVLANVDSGTPDSIGRDLGNAALGLAVTLPDERTEIPMASAAMQDLPGVYRLSPEFAITVTLEGDALMSAATGQGKFRIFPEANGRFFLKVVDAELGFNRDPATKKVVSLTLYQNGAAQVGTREP